jgi:UDP-sugar pyrophosphorylase
MIQCTQVGVKVEEAAKEGLYGLEVWPAIVWHPEWALTISGVRQKMLNGNNLKASSITHKSALVIKGQQITFNSLHLDGTLLVRAVRGAQVRIVSSTLELSFNST